MARAVPALVLAVVITFTANHSATLGYLTFGIFTVIVGTVLAAFALRASSRGVMRTVTVAQALITVIAGIVALAVPAGGLPFLVFLVTTFAAVTGMLELYLGLRSRGRDRSARDWVFIGGLTAILALAVLLVPPGFEQSFTGPDGVARVLTASVIVVGSLGAYWAIFGIYLVIAGLSLKWGPTQHSSPAEAEKAEI